MGQTKARAERQRRSAKAQRQGPAPIWTEPAAQADETRHPTKRDGKAQQHGHLSHGAIAKAKRLSDLAQRLQTLIADQFPPSWAAPLKGRGLHRPLLRAYNDAHGMLEPQPFGFKSAHALLHTVLKELLPEAETTRRPKPPRALAACPPVRPAQQALLWRAPTVACRVYTQPAPSSQLHAQMLRFAELMLPDLPTLRLRREALHRVTQLAEDTFPGCQAPPAW